MKWFDDILGTTDWSKWLFHDPQNLGPDPKKELGRCLAAISDFCTASGHAVCLQGYGDGIIKLAGLHIDKVTFTGETAYSEDILLSVVHSWASSAYSYFLDKAYRCGRHELGDAFRRTLCADTITIGSDTEGFTTRRVADEDHHIIAAWFLKGKERIDPQRALDNANELSSYQVPSGWETVSQDLGNPLSYLLQEPTLSIDNAIRMATVRRTFFITEKGYIGLGPAKMRVGDDLCVLMGSRTHFILRNAGSREITSLGHFPECFEVVGDAYTNGLMNGEVMPEWRKVAINKEKDDMVRNQLLQRLGTLDRAQKQFKKDLSAWQAETARDVLLQRIETRYLQHGGGSDLRKSRENFGKQLELSEQTANNTSALFFWKEEFDLELELNFTNRITDTDWMAKLMKAAELRINRIKINIAEESKKMIPITQQLVAIERKMYRYLV